MKNARHPLSSLLAAAALLVGSAGCGSSDPAKTSAATDAAADAAATGDTTAADMAVAPTVTATGAPILPPGAPLPTERGWQWGRTVVHIHSAFSHDACDGEIDETGKANPECLQQFRDALCASTLDVAFVTDHPAHMSEYPFEKLLNYRADLGDTLLGPAGAPRANLIQCPASKEVPAHPLLVTVGFEATHFMPVGLQHHISPSNFEGGDLSDAVTLATAVAHVTAAKGAGALIVNAHSEQAEVSAKRLVDAGVDAMEIYNIHANFLTVIGGEGGKPKLGKVFELEHFLGPKEASPWPDLVLMVMLDMQPEAAFTKWHEVLASKHVTALVGNDVHRNVKLEAYCGPGGQFEGLCKPFADKYPNLVKLLTKGGIPLMADGDRLDSYKRMLRQISDRVLVSASTATDGKVEAFQDALRGGRNWVVFDLLGEPDHFDLVAKSGDKWIEMGGTAKLGDELWLRTPQRAYPAAWMPWQEADTRNPADPVEVRTLLWRTTADGKPAEVVQEYKGFAQAATYKATQAGRYHLEVRMIPRHLRPWLKALGQYADVEQRWVVSNPIAVQ
ncbi:MAG: hypothetical protein HY902_09425 [Deltaproteobacteria bacterium]|nr:hypothetical protein [Deltaproteobacteria bacterium]